MQNQNRRKYMRLAREYRIEYGPFSSLFSEHALRPTWAKNVSGGGVLFGTDEELPIGSKIVLSIQVSEWKQADGTYIATPGADTELQLKAIAEVVRVEYDSDSGIFRTGARFVGRVH